jgi:hypothetical protein
MGYGYQLIPMNPSLIHTKFVKSNQFLIIKIGFSFFKEKRFVECKLNQTASCAVVSRLKRDTIYIDKQSSGRFSSSADPRLTIQWPAHVCENNFQLNLRLQPVDLPTFTQFSKNFSHECQGLLAIGPIINLNFDDITLSKPIQFTLPILAQAKKKVTSAKPTMIESNTVQSTINNSTSQPSQQEIVLQQQQSIFKSMLGEGLFRRNFFSEKKLRFFLQ